jgi:hypothetical protein
LPDVLKTRYQPIPVFQSLLPFRSDRSWKMIQYTNKNLTHLTNSFQIHTRCYTRVTRVFHTNYKHFKDTILVFGSSSFDQANTRSLSSVFNRTRSGLTLTQPSVPTIENCLPLQITIGHDHEYTANKTEIMEVFSFEVSKSIFKIIYSVVSLVRT